MRYLVLHQTDNGQAASLVEADTAADALDALSHCNASHALLIHEGTPVPDVYDYDGDAVTVTDAPVAVVDEPDPEPDTAEEPTDAEHIDAVEGAGETVAEPVEPAAPTEPATA